MSNQLKYKGEYVPFRYVGEQLQVFYRKTWLNISLDEVQFPV